MSSQQFHALLEVQASDETLLSFLNSRFKSVEDLTDLESLVTETLQRSQDASSRLVVSQSKTDSLISETRSSATSYLESARDLSLLRHSLADELSSLSQELLSSMSSGERQATLLEDIETLHRELKQLEGVKGYVQIIHHALSLSEQALKQMQSCSAESISEASLTQYKSLQGLVTNVSSSCSKVEDGDGQQKIHLVGFLERILDETWLNIRGVLSASLLAASEKLNWPTPVIYASASSTDRAAFEFAFLNLLRLQILGKKLRPVNSNQRAEQVGLYPIQSLIQPLSLRFKYHFEGTRQTNRLDKPEWYFTHIMNISHEHRLFMETVIQNILSSTVYKGVNAWHEFTYLLLPLLSRKLKRSISSLLSHPSLLAHTIYQALSFDAALIEDGFSISDTSAKELKDSDQVTNWDGISNVILGNNEWFETWMEAEKRFADDQCHDIISSPDAWVIDDASTEGQSGERDLRTTNGARRIRSLVQQVIDRYSPLPDFTHRTRFLIVVQLPLLETFHSRILSSLDAFETLSSAFIRAVPGALGVSLGKDDGRVNVDTGRLTSGVEGVQRLCKALLSALFIKVAMEGWGEELFFLELWVEISKQASLRALAEASRLLPHIKVTDSGTAEDTIFGEMVARYDKLVKRAEDMVVQQVSLEVEAGLKEHFAASSSAQQPSLQDDDIPLSQTLLGPMTLLSSHLTFLRAVLPQTELKRLYRRIASQLSKHILQRQILYRGHKRLGVREGKAIQAEFELWVQTSRSALSAALGGGRNRVEAPWHELLCAGAVVGTEGEKWDQVVQATFGPIDDNKWEEVMMGIVGPFDMGREDFKRVLRSRRECDR